VSPLQLFGKNGKAEKALKAFLTIWLVAAVEIMNMQHGGF